MREASALWQPRNTCRNVYLPVNTGFWGVLLHSCNKFVGLTGRFAPSSVALLPLSSDQTRDSYSALRDALRASNDLSAVPLATTFQ